MAKYQKYAEYKDSGVEWLGEIPSHWNLFSLKRAVDGCTNGFWGSEPDGSNDLCVLRVADFNRHNFTVGLDKLTYRSVSQKEAENRLLKKGDLLLEKSGGGEKTLVGCVVQFNEDFQAITSNFVAKMTPKKHMVSRFLTFAFSHLYAGRVNFPSIKQTTGIQNLDSEAYLMEKFVFPTREEQNQIANFLDYETAKIDTLIAKQEKLIELLKEKRQAVISHAVTKGLNPDVTMKDSGVEWLGEVPEHWAVAKLAYRYEVLLGKMLDESKITGNYLGKYLRNTDVQWGRVNSENLPEMDFRPHEIERYSVQQGDLLVCEGGEIGRCAIWESEDTCFYQKALHRLRAYSSQDSHKFMFYVLFDSVHRERFISGAGKATIAHLPAETFKQYRFAFPPKNEQVQIVEYLDTMSKAFDEIETKALAQIKLLQERRTALISSAVTGKINVSNWQHPNEAKTELSP